MGEYFDRHNGKLPWDDSFPSVDAAVTAVAELLAPVTNYLGDYGTELTGLVGQNPDGTFTPSEPALGTTTVVRDENGNVTDVFSSSDPWDATLPDGTTPAGDWHTHNSGPHWQDNHDLYDPRGDLASVYDHTGAFYPGEPSYVATYIDGQTYVQEFTRDWSRPVNYDGPKVTWP